MIVPPGIPNTISQPTASSERTSEEDPVTRTGDPPGGAGFGGGPGRGAGCGPGTGACREVALVIFGCLWLLESRHEKTPANHECGRTRVARRRRTVESPRRR